MKIVYKDSSIPDYDIKYGRSEQPLRYRVYLRRIDDYFEIERKYFKSGFHDGEQDDVVFIPHRAGNFEDMSYISIMTQKLEDKKYLKSLEKIVIDTYVNECKRLLPILNIKLKNHIKYFNSLIRSNTESLNFLSNYDRREKLKQINLNNEKNKHIL